MPFYTKPMSTQCHKKLTEMCSQKITISFPLESSLNVTWRNIKLLNTVQGKQKATKGAAANAAAVSFIV